MGVAFCFGLEWIPSHTTESDAEKGLITWENRIGNASADETAKAAATTARAPKQVLDKKALQEELIRALVRWIARVGAKHQRLDAEHADFKQRKAAAKEVKRRAAARKEARAAKLKQGEVQGTRGHIG